MTIDYQNIDIYQGEHRVLANVCFQVEEGEMVYLVGPVGSGKSSLLKTLYGEVKCQGERARILDYDLLRLRTSQHPSLRRQLGIVFQDFRLLPDRTVCQNLDFVLRATDWKKKARRQERIEEVLGIVKLQTHIDKHIWELSGGEQQRVSIARALLNNPKVILADEPTGNLDTENGELILATLDEIRRQQGTSILISTHNLQWPQFFPGTIYQCGNGQLIRQTPSAQLPAPEEDAPEEAPALQEQPTEEELPNLQGETE